MSYGQLFPKLVAGNLAAPVFPPPIQPRDGKCPKGYNYDERCEFHGGNPGHSIENCFAFKKLVQRLLNADVLKFDAPEKPNPLPNHAREGVNAITKGTEPGRRYMVQEMRTPMRKVWQTLRSLGKVDPAGAERTHSEETFCELHGTSSHDIQHCTKFLALVQELIDIGELTVCKSADMVAERELNMIEGDRFESNGPHGKHRPIEEMLREAENKMNLNQFEAKELSLVPDLVIPHKFKVPSFEKYNGTTCPLVHLTMFCRKMTGFLGDEKLLIFCFHDSLTGPALVWYNQLSKNHIQSWEDLAKAFSEQYRFVKDTGPDRLSLQRIKMRATEGFTEYALRWRGIAAQVQPPMLEKEMIIGFIKTLHAPYYDLMIGGRKDDFANCVLAGEMIEDSIRQGKLKTTTKYGKSSAGEDEINECSFQVPRTGKRKRSISDSSQSQKFPRVSTPLKIFEVPISDLFPHLIKGQYLTPVPAKEMPNPSSMSYHPNSICDFHKGMRGHSTGECRQLVEDIKRLVKDKVLTKEQVSLWGHIQHVEDHHE